MQTLRPVDPSTSTGEAKNIALISLNIFRNYFNLVAGTEVDFPLVSTNATDVRRQYRAMSTNVQTIRPSATSVRQIAGQVLIYVAGFGLLAAAITKFAHLPPVVAQLN